MTVAGADADTLDQVARAVSSGECILFLGAGAHAPAPPTSRLRYPEPQRPPIGSQLSRLLAQDVRLTPDEDPTNLQRVALFYEIQRSRRQLVEAVRNAVYFGKAPSPMLAALARLDFPVVITTNYDQLFETALMAAGKQPRISVYSPEHVRTEDHRSPTAQSPVLFKIHGDITKESSVVITDEDYIQFVLRMSDKDPFNPLPLGLKYHLTGYTTLFVGYSLLDYNLRLLFKTLRWQMDQASIPDMYSVDFRPDPLIRSVWEEQRRYLRFIVDDVWEFVPELYRRVTGEEFEP